MQNEQKRKVIVPCWVCKGSGEAESEEYIDFGLVVPAIPCDWCEYGMIEIGSEQHKKYKEATKEIDHAE